MLVKTLFFMLAILVSKCIIGAEHWAIGGWDCRSWGAIRVLDDGYVIDLDPEGDLQNWGIWQDRNENAIIIVWMESSMLEIIERRKDKFVRQSAFTFGVSSDIEETKKILTEEKLKEE